MVPTFAVSELIIDKLIIIFPFMKTVKPEVSYRKCAMNTKKKSPELMSTRPPIPDSESLTSLICHINPGVIKAFLMNEPFVRGRGWTWGGGRGLPETRQVFNHFRCSANEAVERQKDALVGLQFKDHAVS